MTSRRSGGLCRSEKWAWAMGDLAALLDDMRGRIGELERRAASRSRVGVIDAVDAAKGLARVKLLDGERPFLTGWIPWQEAAAGAMRTHMPPSVGQQVKVVSESGDLTDATIQGSLNSDGAPRPSGAGDAFVLGAVGSARIEVTGGGAEVTVKVGGVKLVVSGAGVAITGGKVTHNGTDIGDTHKHVGVVPGPSETGVPVG